MMSEDLAWFETARGMISSQYPGMWVVVKNRAIVGAYPDYESAYSAGVAMFGTETFVVKQATPQQIVETAQTTGISGRFKIGQGYATDVAEMLRQTGAIVNVQIGIPAALARELEAQGKTVPPPQIVKAMIDTGASISTVSEAVASAAGLQSVGSVPISGVGGTQERPVMAAAFGLPDYGLTVDPAEIVAISINAPGFEVLLGRDIMKALRLDYQGKPGVFAVSQEFDPSTGRPVQGSGGGPSTGTIVAIGAGALALGVAALFAFDVL